MSEATATRKPELLYSVDDASLLTMQSRFDMSKERLLGDDNDYLPPKSFAAAKRKKCHRAFNQIAMVVLGITICCAVYFGFNEAFNFGHVVDCTEEPSNVFQFSVVLGNYTMTQAKFLDVGFNVGGRVVQTIMAYVSYLSITAMLMRTMERTPVSFALYSTLTIQPCDVQTLWITMQAFFYLPGLRPRLIMLWAFLSAAFVIAIPTLVDLMSGYVPKQEPYIAFPDDTLIKYTLNIDTLQALELLHGNLSDVYAPPTFCVHTQDHSYQWGVSAL
ncbi:uncharacterized protein LY89DRAFT_502820 [Mollisia scopiformis]|uniref:Uncharacterized protein n=1 Tax=Mollisia scopiformis TaxID=149040 RepID=A0A194XEZ1_MOLSC|nr:uncharacterized protein LY89DRAFT_502820 [Mollisia scopiformis]KUJ18704.1 hypothetical protein LY89DRAFT_502820 [Mollisia scopiformis]